MGEADPQRRSARSRCACHVTRAQHGLACRVRAYGAEGTWLL